ncbi:hypothetical protein [Kutzneria buriramensis]|uniref:DUF222 domain-containing protein n=1 Tax=Kutzneria buriramensis TaxID=1045776 RepID=A0A3E0HDD2_9PSEU|nr:hypothetical protein [Kutzneria buriramensis]REH42796.1 hypothetical protein BCF44_110295 [Kutzneria buriramensis]
MQEIFNEPDLLAEAMNLTEGDHTDGELVEMVKKLVRMESAVRAALSQTVAVAISQGAQESAGHATVADLLRTECHLSGREANELALSAVRLREQLHHTFVALQSGLITWAHATTLVRSVDRLGTDTVQEFERDWIELIASRTSPEALQRVVHTHHVERVGYPSPNTESQIDRQQATFSGAREENASTSTDVPEAVSRGSESASHGCADVDNPAQDWCTDASVHKEPQGLTDFPKPSQPEHDREASPATPLTTERQAAATLTLSSDNDEIAVAQRTTPTSGCRHTGCAAEASLREVSFTVRWLDGGRSSFLGYGLLCDEHCGALASCSVDRIRVGHSTMIRTIGPALVTDAA